MLYLDSSALVKLIAPEPGSDALDRAVAGNRIVSSDLARVEVTRAAHRTGLAPSTAQMLLRDVTLVRLDPATLSRAAALSPPGLGTLDAIHLATALAIGPALEAFITYDRQLGRAAAAAGLRAEAPRGGRAV